MKAKWIIEPDCMTGPEPIRLRDAAIANGHEVQMLPMGVTTSDLGHKVKFNFPDDDCVVVYGSLELVKYLKRKHKWIPTDWCDFGKLRAVSYMAHWGKWSIHQDYGFYPLKTVIDKFPYFLDKYGNTLKDELAVFVRSDSNDKIMGGAGLVTANSFEKWQKNINCYDPSPETLVLVSRPSIILREWRLVMADGRFLTGSRYRLGDDVHLERMQENEVSDFAERVLRDAPYDVAPIFCMDIAETNNGLAIVEIGSVNTCGLYECDMNKVYAKMSEIAEREHKENNEI